MMAAKEFLRESLRLLYWVFFKPTALRAHINQIAPGYEERLLKAERGLRGGATVNLRELRENPKLRRFVLKALLVIICAPAVLYLSIGLAIIAFGGDFNWQKSWDDLAGGVAGGVAIVVAGVGAFGGAFGVAVGFAVGVTVGATFGPMATRLPIYLFELLLAIRGHRHSLREKKFEQALRRSPIYFDEFIFFPQPYLSSLLFHLTQQDALAGLTHIAFVANHPYQNWAAQKALKRLLTENRAPFFPMLDRMLASPAPYQPITFEPYRVRRASFRYYSVLAMLAEVADISQESGRVYKLARGLTYLLGLRTRAKSRYAPFAAIYHNLLDIFWDEGDDLFDSGNIEVTSIIEMYQLDDAVSQFEEARGLPHGEEFYQSLRLINASLHCESLQQVAKLRDEFGPLFEIDDPLRPLIVIVFRRLRDAAIDAASFLAVAHEITRRDALLKAQGVLEEARRLADEVYEPERSLLLAVIEHWRRMFAVEGGRVAERVVVETLPNPYIVGRPIRPEDGRLFAGRREEFLAIEEKLQTGVGLVIYGQRRIGKSSILLHLGERLPHSLLPVYLNLQQLMANTTGGFLRAVGNEIVKQLSDKLDARRAGFIRKESETEAVPPEGGVTNSLARALPPPEEFAREPFLSLNQLLDEIERRLAPGQRLLLSFDEFEVLEQRVNAGKIEKEIFAYLRGVTQTGRGFTLLFAGLHTLEQMTREYWNPFFQSVQTVRIGYLSELDARQLIIDPVDQFPLSYDEEAIDRIIAVTNSHPYLMQNVCHNLVNRLNDPFQRSNRAKVEDVEAVLEKTLETSGYYFDDYVWNWSSADERVALSLLAEAGEWAGFAMVERHLGREAALDATRSLVARSILKERTDRDELVFRFQIPLSRMWAQKTKPSARVLMERGRL
jgi:AAA+ ATPase superfamily predicted ATPase